MLRGVKTNIPFLKNIMEEPDFLSGKFDTSYLDTHPDLYEYDHDLVSEDLVVTLSAAIAAYEGL